MIRRMLSCQNDPFINVGQDSYEHLNRLREKKLHGLHGIHEVIDLKHEIHMSRYVG